MGLIFMEGIIVQFQTYGFLQKILVGWLLNFIRARIAFAIFCPSYRGPNHTLHNEWVSA